MRKDVKILEDFKGVNQALDETNIDKKELHTFENGRLKRFGDIGKPTKRFGYERFNSNQFENTSEAIVSLHEHITQDNSYLIGKNENSIDYCVGTAYTADWIGAAGGSYISSSEVAGRIDMTSFKNKLYVCNRNAGADVNKVWDETNYLDHGCPPFDSTEENVTLTPVAGGDMTPETGGGARDAQYFYFFTWLYDDYQESGTLINVTAGDETYPQLMSANMDANTAVDITFVDTGNARVSKIKIYRTKVSAITSGKPPSEFYFVAAIEPQTTYTDVIGDDSLGDAITVANGQLQPYYDTKKPFRSKYHVVHRNRLFQAYLNDDLLNAIPNGDITVTLTAGGNLEASKAYSYRFYKVWVEISGTHKCIIRVSKPLTVTPDATTATHKSYDITYSGSNDWFKTILFMRTSGDGTDYKVIGDFETYGVPIDDLEATYSDTVADANRVEVSKILNIPEDTVYESKVVWSDPDRPDLFTAGNELNIGQDDGQYITGIFSEEGRLVIFKTKSRHEINTRSQDSIYWSNNKLEGDIGADEIVQTSNGYVFYTSRTVPSDGILIYQWDGRNQPVLISSKIQPLLDGSGHGIYGMVYDKENNTIIMTTITNGAETQLLIYDLELQTWFIDKNVTTDLDLHAICSTKSKGILYGSGAGYVYYNKDSTYQDKLGAEHTATAFNLKMRTKTFAYAEGSAKLEKIWALVGATGSGSAFYIKHSVDGAGLIQNAFSVSNSRANAIEKKRQVSEGKQFYLQVENAENIGCTLKHLGFEAKIRHQKRRDD